MRIYQKALIREMSETGIYALAALAAIIIVTLIARILGRAALGDIATEAVLPFIGFGLMHLLPVILSLALFMAVFLTLTRYWRDSEMVVWFGSGLSHADWLRPVLTFAIPVTLIIALFSLALLPWAAEKRQDYERYLSGQEEIASLTPGLFIEASGGKKVYFVESLEAESERVHNIFIRTESHGRTGIVVAKEGHRERAADGADFLVLEHGRRYEGMPGTPDYRVVEFERYHIRLEAGPYRPRADLARTRPTLDLFDNPIPENQAELAWRLGHPLSALVLAAIAIPLSFFNPRSGHSLNVLFAVLVYTVYNNLIGLSEGWVVHQYLSGTTSMLLIHGSMLTLLLILFWLRSASLRLWRRR